MKKENRKSSIILLSLVLAAVFTMVNCAATAKTENAAASTIPSCGISTVTTNTTIPANTTCAISGIVTVNSPAILTIGAGSTIIADGASSQVTSLVIKPGAQLVAVGTAVSPIVFTSSKAAGSRAPRDWGGVVIRGNATQNFTNSVPVGGNTYCSEVADNGCSGGNNDADNSGHLEYVRVEFGGKQMTATSEYNGFTFESVGNGTVVDYIHAHQNGDDGIEMFGGTVDLKHVISTNNHDDMLDWTYGWRGRVQFIVLGLFGGAGDSTMADSNFIEADNHNTTATNGPVSQPKIYNMTAISDYNGQYMFMFRFRRGTAAIVKNLYVANVCATPDVESATSRGNLTGGVGGSTTAGSLLVNNALFEHIGLRTSTIVDIDATAAVKNTDTPNQIATVCNDDGTVTNSVVTFPMTAWQFDLGTAVAQGVADDVLIGANHSVTAAVGTPGITATDPTITPWSVAPTNAIALNSADPLLEGGTFFTAGSYIGAVQDAANNWTTWTTFAAN